jgi:hypothetical protein
VKALTADLIAQKNTLAATGDGPWVWLLELDRDGTNTVRYAKARANVTFNSQTYTASNMKIEPAKSDAAGGTINFNVTVQNVDQTIITYLEADEIRDRPMLLTLVHADHLSTAANRVDVRGLVISADADEKAVTLNCGTYDLRNVRVPGDTYAKLRCRAVFKSVECGYAGAETSCLKTPDDCDDNKSNFARIGCFPGMCLIKP